MGVSRKVVWPAMAVCLLSALCLWSHQSRAAEPAIPTKPTIAAQEPVCPGSTCRRIEEGDLVTVDYTVLSEDGKLIYTTRARDVDLPKVADYRAPTAFAPEEVTVGKAAHFPGVGESLVGMGENESKRVTLPAEKAFGPANPEMIKTFPTTKTLDKTIRMPAEDYVKQFGGFPSVGKEVNISPYLKAHVSKVTDTSAELEVTAGAADRFEEEYGVVQVKSLGDQFKVTLSPRIGALFRAATQEGKDRCSRCRFLYDRLQSSPGRQAGGGRPSDRQGHPCIRAGRNSDPVDRRP